MKTTLYAIFGILFAIVAFYFETAWASWVIKEIFHKFYNSWAVFGFLVMIAFLTPKSIQGIIPLILLFATIYIKFLH